MSSIVITLKSELTQAHAQQRYQLETGKPREEAAALRELFHRICAQAERATVRVQTGSADPVAAAGTFTLVSAIATDAITIGTVTLTASSTPANENQWEIDGASDALDATSLAAAINAHSVLSQIVTATVVDNVVTVTAKVAGVVGNFIPISSADATITASEAFLEGGTGGVTEAGVSYALGL
jgi:phage tail sheath gpL-like